MERIKNLRNIVLAGLALSVTGACARPLITEEDIKVACEFGKGLKYDRYSPHGFSIGSHPVRETTWGSQEHVNENLVYATPEEAYFLTNEPDFNEFYPQVSPNGKKVVFVREGSHFILPNGDWDKKVSGREGLYVLDIETRQETRLTFFEEFVYDKQPTWSPDGSRVAFARTNWAEFFDDLYTINPDGTDLKNLTRMEEEFNKASKRWETYILHPEYSPDGAKIAFSDTNTTYVIDAEGSNLKKVSQGTSRESPEGADDGFLWLNNRQLRVTRQFKTGYADFENRWYIANADGSAFKDLSSHCTPRIIEP